MTTFARLLASLLGLAVAACAWLPWAVDLNAWHLTLRSLIFPARAEGVSYTTSIGTAVSVAALLVLLGALLNSRALVIIGALLSVAFSTIWIFGNAVAAPDVAIPMTQIQIGAYGAAALGFMILILAAVARDTRVPTAR
jgi:hypothetical protein